MKHLKKFNESIKSEKIPTAEEFLKGNSENEPWTGTQEQAMIDFTKLHVEAALKSAHSNMQLPEEDLEFTMGAYPLENIK